MLKYKGCFIGFLQDCKMEVTKHVEMGGNFLYQIKIEERTVKRNFKEQL